jgi:hypothetical protein
MVSLGLRAFRLLINLLTLSYFTGLFWQNYCEFTRDYVKNGGGLGDPQMEFYLEKFDLESKTLMYNVVANTYYIFTTLATVGLGDYNPRSNFERMMCCFIMLFGAMSTTLLMDGWGKILREINNFQKSYDETEKLNTFLCTLKKYNDN